LRFGVAVSSVVKWSQRYRATGSIKPDRMGRQRKSVLDRHGDFIKERIRQTPHLTLHGLKDELAARGVEVSHNAVWLLCVARGCGTKKRCSLLSKAA
jgi:putative transposase